MQNHFKCSELYKKESAKDKALIQKLSEENSQLKQKIKSLEMNQQANKTKPNPSAATQHLEESKQKPKTTIKK